MTATVLGEEKERFSHAHELFFLSLPFLACGHVRWNASLSFEVYCVKLNIDHSILCMGGKTG